MKEFEATEFEDIIGNPTALRKLNDALPHTHVFLHGNPGVGKSSAIKIWAKKNNFKIQEINVSSDRGQNLIHELKILSRPAFFDKLIVLEEADGINWFKDGLAIFKIMRYSSVTFALIANESYKFEKNWILFKNKQKRDREKRKLDIVAIPFRTPYISSVKKRIDQINEKVGIKIDYSRITTDVRQSITNVFFSSDKSEYTKDVFDRLRALFSQGVVSSIRLDSDDILWIAENIPKAYFGYQILEAFEILELAIKLNKVEVLKQLPRVDTKIRLDYPFFLRRVKATKSNPTI